MLDRPQLAVHISLKKARTPRVTTKIFDSIKQLLADNAIAFRTVHHEPTTTSEESARARGEDVRIGGKAILMKVEEVYRLFVLSAARKIDSDRKSVV